MEMIWCKFEEVQTNGRWIKRKLLWDKYVCDTEWKNQYYRVEVIDWKIYNGRTYAICQLDGEIETIDATQLTTVEAHKKRQESWAHDKEYTKDLHVIEFGE